MRLRTSPSLGGKAILNVSLAMCKAVAVKPELPPHHHIVQLSKNSDLILPVPTTCSVVALMLGTSWPHRSLDPPSGCWELSGCHATQGGGLSHTHLGIVWQRCHQCGRWTWLCPLNSGDQKLPSKALELVNAAIDKAGYTEKMVISMDVATSQVYHGSRYDFKTLSLSDTSLGTRTLLGPILLCPLRLKFRQINLITKAIQVCELAQENGWGSWWVIIWERLKTHSLPVWWGNCSQARSILVPG